MTILIGPSALVDAWMEGYGFALDSLVSAVDAVKDSADFASYEPGLEAAKATLIGTLLSEDLKERIVAALEES